MTEFVLIVYLFTVVCVFGAIGMIVRKWIHRIRTRISFEQSLKKSELIIIPLYNNGKKLNFIVDSGSTCNIINSSIVEELNILEEDVDISKIESISIAGDAHAQNVVSMMLEGKGENFFETFFVMPMDEAFRWGSSEYGEQVHGLLGCDFLTRYRKVIDFDKYIIYTK